MSEKIGGEVVPDSTKKLDSLFSQSRKLETEIKKKLDKLSYE